MIKTYLDWINKSAEVNGVLNKILKFKYIKKQKIALSIDVVN